MISNAIFKISNNKSIVNQTIIIVAMTVIAISPLTSHTKQYFSIAYSPLIMGGVDIMFEGINGAENTNTNTIDSNKFDMTFDAFRIDESIQMSNGIRFAVTAGIAGITTIPDPITFVLSEAAVSGSAILPVDVVYTGELHASNTDTDTGSLRVTSITTGAVSNQTTETDIVSQQITIQGIQDMFIGVQAGYGRMINRMMPYVDVGAGVINTTLNFASGSTDAWGIGLHGRIGLNYMISSDIGIFADYTFMSQLETAFDTAMTGMISCVHKMPESFSVAGTDLMTVDAMSGGLNPNSVDVNVTKNGANNMITLTNSDAQFTAEGTLGSLTIPSLNNVTGAISINGTDTDAIMEPVTLSVPITYNYRNVSYSSSDSIPSATTVKEYKAKIESKYTHHFAIGIIMDV
ncbi:MAG: hypothetical protein P857_585 [Candidatus Xenolissoclinum pacificiensis L6]|uniref:Uncharacterized protein n=1 Tax=Candidatus Xenolissoclinum pacificiensis L6 TaxID=1401685 RepID=W2UYU1_9RICK|nr:MAG: hypothetical protein P857_585 [Candidatus Xenolissoclinum pacificiensis L6]